MTAATDELLDGLTWLSPYRAPLQVAGLGWFATEGVLRRLPRHPDWPLPEAVDRLADATAGGQVRFRTDSSVVAVDVVLDRAPGMDLMPATGEGGIDADVGDWGAQRYWGTARPGFGSDSYRSVVFQADPGMRTVTLNLPLYRGVQSLQIGVDPGAQVAAPPDFPHPGRIAIYGTSVTHGGCASRPGMAYPAILGRRLGHEILNLGFAGNGKGEPEVARVLAQLDDTVCFVLDYETNVLEAEALRTSLTEFIPILRDRHPTVPILVASKPGFARRLRDADYRRSCEERRDIQHQIVERHRAAGDHNLHFVDLGELDIAEGTVDGVHPTDSGFTQLADRFEVELRALLGR